MKNYYKVQQEQESNEETCRQILQAFALMFGSFFAMAALLIIATMI